MVLLAEVDVRILEAPIQLGEVVPSEVRATSHIGRVITGTVVDDEVPDHLPAGRETATEGVRVQDRRRHVDVLAHDLVQ